MKRYYIEAYCRVCDCEIATKKRPSEYGDYYLVTDVERTMIPRPDAEEARKAVDELMYEVEQKFTSPASHREYHRQKMWKARAAVLAKMGVEVK